MYRPPSRNPRGAWARHLHEKRRERNLSQARAFELLYEGLGLSARSRSAYLAIDMGDRQPTEREAAYLATVFGWPPVGSDAVGATETPDALVAALTAQTTEISALVRLLRPMVEAQAVQIDHLQTAVRGLTRRLAQLEPQGNPKTPAPRGAEG